MHTTKQPVATRSDVHSVISAAQKLYTAPISERGRWPWMNWKITDTAVFREGIDDATAPGFSLATEISAHGIHVQLHFRNRKVYLKGDDTWSWRSLPAESGLDFTMLKNVNLLRICACTEFHPTLKEHKSFVYSLCPFGHSPFFHATQIIFNVICYTLLFSKKKLLHTEVIDRSIFSLSYVPRSILGFLSCDPF